MARATQSPEAALDSARRLLADAEQERVLDRIWIHVDMDMCGRRRVLPRHGCCTQRVSRTGSTRRWRFATLRICGAALWPWAGCP